MTAPVTGPFTTTKEVLGVPQWNNHSYRPVAERYTRTGYRQRNPFDLPLRFDSQGQKCWSTYSSGGPFGTFSGSDPAFVLGDVAFMGNDPELVSKSYARLIKSVGEAVQGGVATAEGRQAIGMISQRLGQMALFTRHLFRGRLGLAAGALGLDWSQRSVRRKIHTPLPPPRLLRQPKYRARESVRSLSKIYLEFHFGWSPLVNDIHDALKVIDAPVKNCKVKGSHRIHKTDPTNEFVTSQDATHLMKRTKNVSHMVAYTQRAEIVVSNPNLATMQQYGIANPLAIAWELVPFSFVLDWFVSVGDYLNSLTDFAGLTLINPHITFFTRYNGTKTLSRTALNPSVNNSSVGQGVYEGYSWSRRVGLNGPTIAVKAPKPWHYRRGLAAASLLIQAYPKRVVSEHGLHLARKRSQFRENVFPQFYGKYW